MRVDGKIQYPIILLIKTIMSKNWHISSGVGVLMMKRVIFFVSLFSPVFLHGAGTLTVDQGGTGSVTISGVVGSGSGDIEGVTADYGLSGGGTSGTVGLSLDSDSTSYIQNRNSLQTNTTFYVTSGTVTGKLTVGSIQFPDGTIQVSSPTSGGGSGDIEGVSADYGLSGGGTSGTVGISLDSDSTSYIQNRETVQSATFHVTSGTVAGNLAVTSQLRVDGTGSDSSMSFNGASSSPQMTFDTDNVSGATAVTAYQKLTVEEGRYNFAYGYADGAGFSVALASGSNLSVQNRLLLEKADGNIHFSDKDGTDRILIDNSTMTFNSGSDDPTLDASIDGQLRVHNGTFTVTEHARLSYLNCTGNTNGGSLTTDGNGGLVCSDDDSSAGGGSSPLAVANVGVLKSSPTVGIDFDARFDVDLQGSATAYVQIASNSLTTDHLAANSVGSSELASTAIESGDIEVGDVPDLSGTYLAVSSATSTYLQKSSATATYVANGAGAGGDLSGTYPSPSVTDDSHAHTGTTLSGIDISDDTNLTAGDHITLTGDDLDVDDDFLLNTGDSGTGAYDFGGADSFEIPQAAAPTLDAVGEVALDTSITGNLPSIAYATATADGAMYILSVSSSEFHTVANGEVATYNSSTGRFLFSSPPGTPDNLGNGISTGPTVQAGYGLTTTTFTATSTFTLTGSTMIINSLSYYMPGTGGAGTRLFQYVDGVVTLPEAITDAARKDAPNTFTDENIFQDTTTFNGSVRLPNGHTADTALCTGSADLGRIFIDTNTTSGRQIYVCEGASGWILQGDGGAGSADNLGNHVATVTVTAGFGLTSTTGTFTSTVSINNISPLRLYDADSSRFIALRSSNTVTNDAVYWLPESTGTADQVLAIKSIGSDHADTYWKTDLIDNLGNAISTGPTVVAGYGLTATTVTVSSTFTVTSVSSVTTSGDVYLNFKSPTAGSNFILTDPITNRMGIKDNTPLEGVTIGTHTAFSGTAPSASSCGTTPSVVGFDNAGRITVGTGGVATSCTLTFGYPWQNTPACVANHEGAVLVVRAVATTTTLTIDAATPLTASGILSYICFGRE